MQKYFLLLYNNLGFFLARSECYMSLGYNNKAQNLLWYCHIEVYIDISGASPVVQQ